MTQSATQSMTQSDPVLVWGGGAIGGTMAAYWARAGMPVLMVDVAADHVQACRTSGMQIEGPVDQFTQVIPSVTPDEVKGVFSRVVLAVKALATEQAVLQILPHLAADGVVLSAQNGLNELTIARLAGEERTLGCFVNFGADWLEPGRILFGSRGSVVVGEIAGPIRARTVAMHELLKVFEPDAQLTDNIWGQLWGKLGYLSMVYATALTNESMFDHFNDSARFQVFRRLGSEAMAVARSQGVRPIGFSGFEPAAFAAGASEDEARASMQALCAFRKKSAKSHSGIWRDIAVRKRRSEVDSQIGLIVQLGEQAGVATPMLALLARLIRDIETQRLPQAPTTFMELDTLCQSLTTSKAA